MHPPNEFDQGVVNVLGMTSTQEVGSTLHSDQVGLWGIDKHLDLLLWCGSLAVAEELNGKLDPSSR